MSYSSSFHTFGRLLAPSSASVMTAMFASVVTVLVSMYFTVFKGSILEEYSVQLAEQPNNILAQLEQLTVLINSSEIVATLSVYVWWCILGVIVCALGLALFHIVRGGALFVGTLRFLPANQKPQLIAEVSERLLLRVIGAAGIYGLYQLTLIAVVPIIYTLQQLKLHPEILTVIVSAVVTIIITMILVHLFTIVLRLLMLRIRLFY